jgi:hypothetical protein
MSSTGQVASWAAQLQDLGPIYPFVGWEWLMLAACMAFCLAFVVWKFVTETARYAERTRELQQPGALVEALAADPRHRQADRQPE